MVTETKGRDEGNGSQSHLETGDSGVARAVREPRALTGVSLDHVGRRHTAHTYVESWKWAAFPLLLFIGTRIGLLAFSHIALTLVPNLAWEFGSRDVIRNYPALDGLCRWDCWHYGFIAREGYTEARWTNFFPLFPLFVRGLYQLTGIHPNLALLIVPNVASLASFLVIYRIFTMLAEEAAARSALVLFSFYPFAFFQATGYPESLMIFCSALAILLALRGNHLSAGVALGLGVLARHLTMFAGAALLAAQVRERGPHPKRLLLNPAILGLLIPWLFFGGYCLYEYLQWGNPLAFVEARDQPPWGSLSWWGVQDLLTTTSTSEHVPVMYSYIPFALVTTVGAAALMRRRAWAELAAFGVVFTVAIWIIGMWGMGRYSASCWPAFLPMGVWLSKRPNLQGVVIGIFALFQGLFFYLFAHMFPIL
ncbi:MAG: glycosyltransferase family 39 protein [Chloroflexota bacterium]|nr:glycosyltransferase family 39 protein [Chloroflexota bacterium]